MFLLQEVYVSKDVPDDVKVLFSVVANRFQKVAREYDPALALQGEAVYDGKRLLARKSEMGLLGGAEFP